MTRGAAIAGVALAMALPWNAWLGVATVPEAMTGALVAARPRSRLARRARRGPGRRRRLFAASLSRYEAWPVCAVLAIAAAVALARGAAREAAARRRRARVGARSRRARARSRGWRGTRTRTASPLHFVARVSAFRQAIGAARRPAASRSSSAIRARSSSRRRRSRVARRVSALAGCSSTAPAARALGVAGRVGARDPRRSSSYGDLRDGAPTHHPERALGTALVGARRDGRRRDPSRRWRSPRRAPTRDGRGDRRRRHGVDRVVLLPGRWAADAGAGATAERRDAQIARGRDLRARGWRTR